MKKLVLIVCWIISLSAQAQDGVSRIPLALDQAIAMALEHNLDIAVQRESIRSAEAGVQESLGAFDPALGAGYTRGEDQRSLDAESSTAAAGLDRVRTETESANLSISGQTPLSTRYSLGARNNRSAGTFNEFQDEHVSSASATLTQPLLRGLGRNYATYGVRLARRNLRVGKLDFRIQVERTLIDVEKAYWELIRADRNLTVRQKSVDASASLLKQIEIRKEVGTASEADLVQARSGLAQRELTLLAAHRERSQKDRTLKDLVLAGIVQPAPPFEPADQPDTNRVTVARDEVVRQALARRPELRKTEISLLNAKDALARAKHEKRPQVDLEASYGLNGLGGSFGDSLDAAQSNDDNSWSVGLVYRKAWPDRERSGAIRRQESALRTEALRVRQERRRIILEIDTLYDRLLSVRDQTTAGELAVALARLNLENEQTKYEVQKSTVHDMLLLEAELMEAELSLAEFGVEHQIVKAELERARGTLLERWGIELE